MSEDRNLDKEAVKTNRQLRVAEGEMQHYIDMFGDSLAEKYGYARHRGIEAVWWFLIDKYKWTPATVRSLNYEDLSFLMEEERASYKVKK